jgi:hypothetical protein
MKKKNNDMNSTHHTHGCDKIWLRSYPNNILTGPAQNLA